MLTAKPRRPYCMTEVREVRRLRLRCIVLRVVANVIYHGIEQRGTGPEPHAVVVVESGVTYLDVQTVCVVHHHGNDFAVRGVPSGHYTVYGDTLLRVPLRVIPVQTSVYRKAAMMTSHWQGL